MRIKNLWFLFLAVAFLTVGCSKKSDNPVNTDNSPEGVLSNSGNIVINGAGYTNKNFSLTAGISAYTTSNSSTLCLLYGKADSDSIAVIVSFPAKTTGTFDWQGLAGTGSSYIYDGCSVSTYGSSPALYAANTGKTIVNVFGDVGKTIEGTFSGTLQGTDGIQTMTVSGSFKCIRVQDEN